MGEKINNSDQAKRKSREWWIFIIGAGVLSLVTAVLAATVFWPKTKKASYTLAPGFVLRDQNGRLTSLVQFRGKVVVMAFIDPECTQICPITTKTMVDALKIVGPSTAREVQLLGVNVNPMKTSTADVEHYTHTHELDGRWRFLTGTVAQLKQVWKAYHVYVGTADGDIEHAAVVYVIDPKGREWATYSTPMSYSAADNQAQTLATQIVDAMRESPAGTPGPDKQQPAQSYLGPDQTVSLPALGPKQKSVTVGRDHPHLEVFFAGWLARDHALTKDLDTLDNYERMAKKQDWPSPVAIDELSVEPSAAEARQTLAPIAASLHTPIVQDASGRLADGYLVADLPWYVLSSSSGKIVWYHDGWLSAAALGQNVRKVLASSTKPADP